MWWCLVIVFRVCVLKHEFTDVFGSGWGSIQYSLNMFYKERSDLVTSWGFSDFYSRSLKLFFRFSNFIVVL